MNILPVNKYILIEPAKRDSFVSSDKQTYEEVGIVLEISKDLWYFDEKSEFINNLLPHKGDKVWFDSWLAGKYPTGKDGEFFWLVKWDDVRAIERNDEIPK